MMEDDKIGAPTTPGEGTILCCECGVNIRPNPVNMCVNCLKSRVDITTGISKQITIFWCRGCGRYQKPPYIQAELESPELLSLCLKKIKGLNKEVKLVDAGFVWTEPHSKRIKVKLTVQKEVFNAAIIQQVFVVEFIVQNQQCPECERSYTEHDWTALVQVRQHVKHKKTFFYLEQLLLKHKVCDKVMYIKEENGGLDFYWTNKSHAEHFIRFLQSVVPVMTGAAKKLISHDNKSNVYNYKFTLTAEIPPICKDDLVCLPSKLAQSLGGVSQLLLCLQVHKDLHFVDPVTLKTQTIIADRYWRNKFGAVLSANRLVKYQVLDITVSDEHHKIEGDQSAYNAPSRFASKLCLAEVVVARESDFGKNDKQFNTITHLGNFLKVGDMVLGYDLTNANLMADMPTKIKGRELPDVILVRKTFPEGKNRNRARKRKFVLKTLKKEQQEQKKMDQAKDERDWEDFQQDIEEDPELSSAINLYKRHTISDAGKQSSASTKTVTESKDMASDDEEDELPGIQPDQLLDDVAESLNQMKTSDPTEDDDQEAIDFTGGD